jgi:hypothetical protein
MTRHELLMNVLYAIALTDDNTESQIDIWLRWNPKALWHY